MMTSSQPRGQRIARSAHRFGESEQAAEANHRLNRKALWRSAAIALLMLAVVLPTAMRDADGAATSPDCGYGTARLLGWVWADSGYNESTGLMFFRTQSDAISEHVTDNLEGLDLDYVTGRSSQGHDTFRFEIPGYDDSFFTSEPSADPFISCNLRAFLAGVIESEGSQAGKVLDDPKVARRHAIVKVLNRLDIRSTTEGGNVFAVRGDWPEFQEVPFVGCGRVPGGRDNCILGQTSTNADIGGFDDSDEPADPRPAPTPPSDDCGDGSCDPVDDSAEVPAIGSLRIDVLDNDPLGAADIDSLVIVDGPARGKARVASNTIRYEATAVKNATDAATDSLTYQICADGHCAQASVAITVVAPDCQGVEANAWGTDGADTITGTAGDDVIVGFAGADTIDSGDGDDIICGDDGNDTIRSGSGDDVVHAGSGHDTVEAGPGDDKVFASGGADSVAGGQGADRISGSAGNDSIWGNTGNDIIDAGGGDDWVNAGHGNDKVIAGAGNDKVHGSRGNDVINGGANDDRLFGSIGNDRINGDDGDDIIHGHNGEDELNGNAGDDRIFGYADDDVIDGGSGEDQLNGNDGDDRINGGLGQDSIYGAEGNDTLLGGADDDVIAGNDGRDSIKGEGGNDELDGGSSRDDCNGGAGLNTAVRCETIT